MNQFYPSNKLLDLVDPINRLCPFASGLTDAFIPMYGLSGGSRILNLARVHAPGTFELGASWTHSYQLRHHSAALQLGAGNDVVTAPAFYPYLPCTYAAIVKTAQTAVNQYVVVHSPSAAVQGLGLFRFANTTAWGVVITGGGTESFPGCVWPDNEWTFIAAKFPPTNTTPIRAFSGLMSGGVFHDETDLSGVNAFTPLGTPQELSLGGYASAATSSFGPGQIAAVFRWGRELETVELKQFWQEAMAGYPNLLNWMEDPQVWEAGGGGGGVASTPTTLALSLNEFAPTIALRDVGNAFGVSQTGFYDHHRLRSAH